MIKDYKSHKIELPGFPFIEINDPPYFQEDLYEIIGSKDYVATFVFLAGSDSQKKYGESITGPIFYPKGAREEIEKCIHVQTPYPDLFVRVNIVLPSFKAEISEYLKYNGFPISDIQAIVFSLNSSKALYKEPGIKSVPNIINVPLPKDFKIDYDNLVQNFALKRLRSGTVLIPEEKAEFVGSILACDNNKIDLKILQELGYTVESASEDTRIWHHFYLAKKRKNKLSENEVEKLRNYEEIDLMQKGILLMKEMISGLEPGEIISASDFHAKSIVESLKKFRPKVIIPIKRQIWWDTKSYLHIVLRHVKDLQFGRIHKRKTPFPYDFKELELLIQKVLDSIIEEIKTHFEGEKRAGTFYRTGKMSVYYNGDYYSLRISPDGLLETIYVVEEKS
jgi:hypothetical protein